MDYSLYDEVEVHPVLHLETPGGEMFFEVCERDDPDIHCWSVYLHLRVGGVECIADCPTEDIANMVAWAVRRHLQRWSGGYAT
jgi:hypothetical protein